MSIPDASTLAEQTPMNVTQAKDYLAILQQIKTFGNYDDANLEIMHQAILAEAEEQGIEILRMAISVLFDFREEARARHLRA